MTAGSVAQDAATDEHLGLNERLGAFVTRKVGSMWSVYITIVFMVGWIVLATIGPLNKSDPYRSLSCSSSETWSSGCWSW
jgi:uncharacterized membrane protein